MRGFVIFIFTLLMISCQNDDDLTFRMPCTEDCITVSGKVQTVDGHPIPDVEIDLMSWSGGNIFQGDYEIYYLTARTNEDGFFTFDMDKAPHFIRLRDIENWDNQIPDGYLKISDLDLEDDGALKTETQRMILNHSLEYYDLTSLEKDFIIPRAIPVHLRVENDIELTDTTFFRCFFDVPNFGFTHEIGQPCVRLKERVDMTGDYLEKTIYLSENQNKIIKVKKSSTSVTSTVDTIEITSPYQILTID